MNGSIGFFCPEHRYYMCVASPDGHPRK